MKCFSAQPPVEHMWLTYAAWAFLAYFYPEQSAVVTDMSQSVSPTIDAQQTCDWPLAGVSEDWKWKCGIEVNIFTNMEPDDMWSIAALFTRANSLRCAAADYPIKTVFGGGGYNDQMTFIMLRQYLLDLRDAGVVPGDEYFNIDRRSFAGPTSRSQDRPRYRTWGIPFDPTFTRSNPQLGYPVNPLTSTISHLWNLWYLNEQRAPIIIAMRPLSEFVVCWFESVQKIEQSFIPSTEEYENEINGLGWDKQYFVSLMEIFKKSRIAMYTGDFRFEQMRYFYGSRIALIENYNSPRIKQMEQSFLQLPQQVLLIDRQFMLTNGKGMAESSLFTAISQSAVYAALRSHAKLFSLLVSVTQNWNQPKLKAQDDDFTKGLPQGEMGIRLENHFAVLRDQAPDLAAQAIQGPVDSLTYGTWKRGITWLSDRIKKESGLSPQDTQHSIHALRFWSRLAPAVNSFVAADDLLLPFVLEPGENVVKGAFRRVDCPQANNVSGQLEWPLAEDTSNSTAFYTWIAPQPETATKRVFQLAREIRELYTLPFSSATGLLRSVSHRSNTHGSLRGVLTVQRDWYLRLSETLIMTFPSTEKTHIPGPFDRFNVCI